MRVLTIDASDFEDFRFMERAVFDVNAVSLADEGFEYSRDGSKALVIDAAL
jgi:hypothetical protein